VDWPLAGAAGGSAAAFIRLRAARMLVIEARGLVRDVVALRLGCALAWARAGTAGREIAHAYLRWPDLLAVPKRVGGDGCGAAV